MGAVLGVTYGGSFAWGAIAASSLLIGGLIALWFKISIRWIGLIMGFGSGVLISAVAFELIEESFELAGGGGRVVFGLLAGCLVFFIGNELVSRMGGEDRKDPTGANASGNGLSIVLGSVLDGVPESMVIGLTLVQGGSIGVAYISAVFLSNLPEGISATQALSGSWSRGKIVGLWALVIVVSALASLAGYASLESASNNTVAFVQTFAAGAILTMLASTMMPEAFEHGGNYVGIATTLGFATAYALHVFG
jgi:zinc transporter, ZIP family